MDLVAEPLDSFGPKGDHIPCAEHLLQTSRLYPSVVPSDILLISRSRPVMTSTTSRSARARTRQGMVFRFRDADTRFGVSRRTTARLAKQLGMTETEVIHFAIAQLARDQLPGYEPDDAALTPKQLQRIKQLEPQGRMRVTESLF